MTYDLMIDIETLGTSPGCIVLQIGAVPFNDDVVEDGHEWTISRESCEDLDLEADPDTVDWWRRQPKATREAVMKGSTPLQRALDELRPLSQHADHIWAKSPSFDCRILEECYARVGDDLPWGYWSERDVRTIEHVHEEILGRLLQIKAYGAKHTARGDARGQAGAVKRALRRLSALREGST